MATKKAKKFAGMSPASTEPAKATKKATKPKSVKDIMGAGAGFAPVPDKKVTSFLVPAALHKQMRLEAMRLNTNVGDLLGELMRSFIANPDQLATMPTNQDKRVAKSISLDPDVVREFKQVALDTDSGSGGDVLTRYMAGYLEGKLQVN